MANINIRVDDNVKQQAQELFSQLGLDTTTAINIFLRQSIREHGIPFEIKADKPNEETLKAIAEVDEMINNPNKIKKFNSIDDLFKELDI